MTKLKEKPFEYLRKNNGELFEEDIVRNWYIARAYILNLLKEIEENNAFAPDSKKHLHVVVMCDNPRMLFVVRQVALSTHYINYHEDCEDERYRHRTILTIVTRSQDIKEKLSAEEYLCNLPKYCKFVVTGQPSENEDSYIDIEIHIESDCPPKEENALMLIIKKEDVDSFFDQVEPNDENIFSIDTRKAFYASKMYNIGETIDNLPAENIHDTKRYTAALNVYLHDKLKEVPKSLFEDAVQDKSQYELKEALSNVFCADCFESRANAISQLNDAKANKGDTLWEKYNEALSRSEHARWVVEKLILGYRPLNAEERFVDNSLSVEAGCKEKRKRFRDSLKHKDSGSAHIDLCSYRDLRRINPNDLKYDSFLMLAIPKILEKIRKDDK